MRNVLAVVLLGAAFLLASWLGWWMLPLVALLWGMLHPTLPRPILAATLAGGFGWAAWLGWNLAADPEAFSRVTTQLGGILQLSPWLLVAATVLFPMLLAWSAATLGWELRARLGRAR